MHGLETAPFFFIADSWEGDRRMTRRNSAFIRHTAYRNKIPLFLTAIFSGALCAHAATIVVTNRTPVYADREVSQHVKITSWDANTREFSLELSLTATPSNNVQVAFGFDASKDGYMPAEETKMTVGWLAGKWFILSEDQRVTYTSGSYTGTASRTLLLTMKLNPDLTPKTLAFKNESGDAITFSDFPEAIPVWMRPRSWDTARLTARGWDDRDEEAKISLVLDGTKIIFR